MKETEKTSPCDKESPSWQTEYMKMTYEKPEKRRYSTTHPDNAFDWLSNQSDIQKMSNL